jgi:hypothetical protein
MSNVTKCLLLIVFGITIADFCKYKIMIGELINVCSFYLFGIICIVSLKISNYFAMNLPQHITVMLF